MSQPLVRASEWLYHGVWAVLVRWFRVPADPPALPVLSGENIQAFKPSHHFLRYLKFQFWVALTIIDLAVATVWVIILVAAPVAGIITFPIALIIIVTPNIASFVALHLRFDTTWYVVSDRSLRIRRGIWVIRETTITFENIQNVSVDQGPLQRWFGIADVQVQTAGGGGTSSHGQESAAMMGGHNGLIEGIDNAPQIRDLIMSRLQRSISAGLGDDHHDPSRDSGQPFTSAHLGVLREIRETVQKLSSAPR
jgi:membrane protein YdbS with pleckstrin-like domain